MSVAKRKNTTLVLGAGFSVPAGGPLLGGLLQPDDVAQTTGVQSELFEVASRIAAIVTQGRPVNLEQEFTRIERAAAMQQSYVFDEQKWKADRLSVLLRRHIVRVCSKRIDLRRTKTVAMYRTFLQHVFDTSSTVGVVTFNYDHLLEHFFDAHGVSWSHGRMANMRYDSERRRRSAKQAVAPILKLHGSVTWGLCIGCPRCDHACLITVFDKPYRANPRTPCVRCKELLEPGIVPPVLMKANEASLLLDAWKQAAQVLRTSERIIIVGYSLPPGDEEAKTLLGGLGQGREVLVICGSAGATNHVQVMGQVTDTGQRLEEYVISIAEPTAKPRARRS